jgi:tRNA (mo5U34)-methyltransferase
MEFPNGETTPGDWDLRPTAREIPWPDLAGARCLDVGTADGFWAFEMERRGAAHVLATDTPSPFQERSRRNFDEAKATLGSAVDYRVCNLFDLDGEWDVVFMGFVLQMVTDPIGALAAVRRVCRGQLLLLDTISLPLALLPSPLARLDARRDGREWFVFNPRGLRKAVELAGWTVDAQTRILHDHQPRARTNWKWITGVRGRSLALRATPNS